MQRLLANVVCVGAALILLQDLNALDVFALGSVDPWYWDRMRGWCSNPNQFALLCLIAGLLSLHAAERWSGWRARTFALLCACLALASGVAAKSNAYVIVATASVAGFAALKLVRLIAASSRPGSPLLATATAVAALAVFCLSIAVPAYIAGQPDVAAKANVARDQDKENDEVGLRLTLWRQALDRGAESWLLGLGPGPHLDIPSSVLAGRRSSAEPANVQHPEAGLAPNFEAHNTLLEFLVQGGALAVTAFLWVFVTACLRAWRAGMDGLLLALVAILAFGSFHVVGRHPVVWFSIVLGLATLPRTPRGETARIRTITQAYAA